MECGGGGPGGVRAAGEGARAKPGEDPHARGGVSSSVLPSLQGLEAFDLDDPGFRSVRFTLGYRTLAHSGLKWQKQTRTAGELRAALEASAN